MYFFLGYVLDIEILFDRYKMVIMRYRDIS